VAEQVDRQPVTTREPAADFGPVATSNRVNAVAAELAGLVQAATTAAMNYRSDEAAKILAAAEREAPQRAAQGQGGGTDGGVDGS